MDRKAFQSIMACGLLALAAVPAQAQLEPNPPPGKVWEMQENGDAIQKDLDFIVPKRWKNFERTGFTSTVPDGTSTKAYYVSDDKALRLGILLQYRVDVRGFELEPETVWSLMKASGEIEFASLTKSQPTEISTGEFRLGGRSPAGRERWVRYDVTGGPEIQGLWWQDIGVWSVVITMSAAENRRAELETAAKTLLAEMPFPSAPLAAEFAAHGKKLLEGLPKCSSAERPAGSGKELVPSFTEAAAIGLVLPGLVLGKANDSLISPISRTAQYCVIEKFNPRPDLEVTALQYTGPDTDTWQARYGFVLGSGRGGYYQVERLVQPEPLKTMAGAPSTKHVYLDFSNNKRASLFTVFDEWPSYEVAKQAVTALHADARKRVDPIMTMTNPAAKVLVVSNPERIQKVD